MEVNTYNLSDGRVLGMSFFEIASFPSATLYTPDKEENIRYISGAFKKLLAELHKLCGSDSCIELMWITEKAANQTFTSKIHIYCILRKIGKSDSQLKYELENVRGDIMTTLASLNFGLDKSEKASEQLNELISKVKSDCLYCIVKSEKCSPASIQIAPYYYSDIIPSGNFDNFNMLIATLSQEESCCVSFQLFPTKLTVEETMLLHELSSQYEQLATGTFIGHQPFKDSHAAIPCRVMSYYNERQNSPLFMYNIAVFGSRASCASISARLVTLMQSGSEKTATSDMLCLDLSDEKISLKRHFSIYPWNVSALLLRKYRNTKLQQALPVAKELYRLAYLISTDEATSFFRLPLYEKSMAALKDNRKAMAQEQFSKDIISDNNIQLGLLTTGDSSEVSIGCPPNAFTKHALIVGTPGSGKTTFAVNLLLQFAEKGIPFLAVEPTKTEYRAMIDAVPEMKIFTPGNNSVSPFIINPFIPPKGVTREQYIPSLTSAFKAAFSMPSPLDKLFMKAIKECYTQFGWKSYSRLGDKDARIFGIHEFVITFKKLLSNMTYSGETKGSMEAAGVLRLTNLLDMNSNIYDNINTVPIEELLTAPTVIELNAIDDAEQKALIMALLLINIIVYTKTNQKGDGKLKNVMLIDEAHVLLAQGSGGSDDSNPDSQASTVKAIQNLIAEIRSYGTSIIIADQAPSKVSREVVANTDIKIAFRLVQSAEKQLIADSIGMEAEAVSQLGKLGVGEAFVYYNKLYAPQLVRTEDIRERKGIRLSVSNEEIAEKCTYWKSHKELLRPYSECDGCVFCKDECNFRLREDAEHIASVAFSDYRKSLTDANSLKTCVFHLPSLMKKEFSKYEEVYNIRQLIMCTRIKLTRKALLELPIELSEEDKNKIITRFPKERE